MQCGNCQFENMPGSERCARCGTSMMLAGAAISVHPPRAGTFTRSRPVRSVRRVLNRVTGTLPRALTGLDVRPIDARFDLATVLRSIVPGWVQWVHGNRPRGRVFFILFPLLLGGGLTMLGTGWGSILLGMAFAVHVASVVESIAASFVSLRDRLILTALCAALLFGFVYYPAGWVVSHWAVPMRLTVNMGENQAGDVVWYSRMRQAATGDVVVHQSAPVVLAGRLANGQAANIVVRGQRISRVIAVEGQSVKWSGRELTVDGKVVRSPGEGFAELSTREPIVPPPGYLCVLPSVGVKNVRLSRDDLRRLAVIPVGSVQGRVFFRSWPLHRVSLID